MCVCFMCTYFAVRDIRMQRMLPMSLRAVDIPIVYCLIRSCIIPKMRINFDPTDFFLSVNHSLFFHPKKDEYRKSIRYNLIKISTNKKNVIFFL